MKSSLTHDFIKYFRKLPNRIQQQARKNYKLWKLNPYHPSLEFKKVHHIEPIYSVRIAIGWRALGLKEREEINWFWIESHADYDSIISKL